MSYEMETADYMVALQRKVSIVEQQNQDLREQNSRLTLALDEPLGWVRQLRAGRTADLQEGNEL